MPRTIKIASLIELFRFYQAALVNAMFGFGLYAAFIWLGLNIYFAQILAQVIGAAFNYLTYSRHVFRDSEPAKFRFFVTYLAQYLLGLTILFIFEKIIPSPYVLGIIVLVITSLANYFTLKYLVFVRRLLS